MTLSMRFSGGRPGRLRWQEAASAWGREVGPLVRSALRDKAPVGAGRGSGRLRDSIAYRQESGSASTVLRFSSTVPYAGFVIGGTRPHIIQARNAQALHWTSGGHSRFARRVNHPGTRPNPFPRRAITPLMPLIQRRFREIVSDQLRSAP